MTNRNTKITTISIDPELVKAVDEVVGDIPGMDRSKFIAYSLRSVMAIKAALKTKPSVEVWNGSGELQVGTTNVQ